MEYNDAEYKEFLANKAGYEKYLEQKKKQNKYKAQYIKKKYRRVVLNFDKESDNDVIVYLDGKENVTDYVRKLIKKDIMQEALKDHKKRSNKTV